MAADRDMGEVEASPIDRDEPIDRTAPRFVEQRLHAAEIAQSFFADVGDKSDRAGRPHASAIQRAHNRHQHGESSAVVADAQPPQHRTLPGDLHVGFLRKDCVEVRGNHQVRTRRRTDPLAADIADLVDAHIPKSQTCEFAPQHIGPRRLFKRRRRHLAKPDLVFNGLRLAAASQAERRLDAGILEERLHDGVWLLRAGPNGQEQHRAHERRPSHDSTAVRHS